MQIEESSYTKGKGEGQGGEGQEQGEGGEETELIENINNRRGRGF